MERVTSDHMICMSQFYLQALETDAQWWNLNAKAQTLTD